MSLHAGFTRRAAELLKAWLLLGALQINFDRLRREGVAALLEWVIKSSPLESLESLESLAIGGGPATLLALIERVMAEVVLGLGAAGAAYLALLLTWTLAVVLALLAQQADEVEVQLLLRRARLGLALVALAGGEGDGSSAPAAGLALPAPAVPPACPAGCCNAATETRLQAARMCLDLARNAWFPALNSTAQAGLASGVLGSGSRACCREPKPVGPPAPRSSSSSSARGSRPMRHASRPPWPYCTPSAAAGAAFTPRSVAHGQRLRSHAACPQCRRPGAVPPGLGRGRRPAVRTQRARRRAGSARGVAAPSAAEALRAELQAMTASGRQADEASAAAVQAARERGAEVAAQLAFAGEHEHRLATALPPARLRVVAEFAPGTALSRARPGQAAALRLDGFPWMQHGSLAAHVERVAGEVREQGLHIELSLDPVAARSGIALQHGLSGRMEVALETVSPARLLLRSLGAR